MMIFSILTHYQSQKHKSFQLVNNHINQLFQLLYWKMQMRFMYQKDHFGNCFPNKIRNK